MLKCLSKVEITVYFSIYLSALLYSIYNIYILRDVILEKSGDWNFVDGWPFINRKRDDLDFEWEFTINFIKNNVIWFIVHLLFSSLCQQIGEKAILSFHAGLSFMFLFLNYGLFSLLSLVIIVTIYYILTKYKKITFIWLWTMFFLLFINVFKAEKYRNIIIPYLKIDLNQSFDFILIMAWCLLRCASFSIEKINRQKIKDIPLNTFSILHMFGYVFYFPTLLLGPILVYQRYENMLFTIKTARPSFDNIIKKLVQLVKELLICVMWIVLTNFALHFLYIHNLQMTVDIVNNLNPWALYGYGYAMGQLFLNKYVVCYGFTTALAKVESLSTPEKPKCIGRIHVYSDMWKYFDRGLYEFLVLYIYKPIVVQHRKTFTKMMASLITFSFIYLWHGFYTFILIWSILNFICLALENIYFKLIKSNGYQQFINKYLNKSNEFRLNALIGLHIFIPSAISNFYFFAGTDIGNIFIKKTYMNSFINYFWLCIVCYCVYTTSEVIKRYEVFKQKTQKLSINDKDYFKTN